MTDIKEREAFEAAWSQAYPLHGKSPFTRSLINPQGYAGTRINDGWKMWQARAALAASQEKAEPVASSGAWSVKPVSFGDIAHILDSAGNHVATVYTNEAKKIAAAHNAAPVAAQASEPDYKFMFEDAVRSLAAIDAALGIDPDEAGGAEPILEAIAELKAAPQPSAEAVRDAALEEAAAVTMKAPITAGMSEDKSAQALAFHASARIRALKSAPPQPAEQPSVSKYEELRQQFDKEQRERELHPLSGYVTEQPNISPTTLEAACEIAALRWAVNEAEMQKLAAIAGPLSRILARAQGEQA